MSMVVLLSGAGPARDVRGGATNNEALLQWSKSSNTTQLTVVLLQHSFVPVHRLTSSIYLTPAPVGHKHLCYCSTRCTSINEPVRGICTCDRVHCSCTSDRVLSHPYCLRFWNLRCQSSQLCRLLSCSSPTQPLSLRCPFLVKAPKLPRVWGLLLFP